MPIIDPAVESYAHHHSSAEPPLLQELAEATRREREHHGMLTGRIEGRLLKMLVQMLGARRVLELGTFTGYSALSMAEGLPADGELITCDLDPAAKTFAEPYFARSAHGQKISIRIGPALVTLGELVGPFDFAFIDADKDNYGRYYEIVLALMRPGGVIAIDNTLWSGRVVAPVDATDRILDGLNRTIASDPRVEHVLLTVRDGVHLVRKR